MKNNTTIKSSLLLLLIFLMFSHTSFSKSKLPENGLPANLKLPSSMPIQDYEKLLYPWLMKRQYQKLGWRKDKTVRDTGPYINTVYYGTHPAVRIYYSPEVIVWLENGRKGELPDGSMIIKEMFTPPAAFYEDMKNNPAYKKQRDYDKFIDSMVTAWTVMVRDKNASKDGWFWANPAAPGEKQSIKKAVTSQLDTLTGPPGSEFGAPCLRCHASAESQFTFSDLKNIEGFHSDSEPLRFLVDTSWRSAEHFEDYPLSTVKNDRYVQSHYILPTELRPFHIDTKAATEFLSHMGINRPQTTDPVEKEALAKPNPEFVKIFNSISPVKKADVKAFPSQWMDQVLPDSHQAQQYMTSDNCLGCHGGLGGEPYGVTMFVKTGPQYGEGYNLSEYGEWRWSPMGVAGRDPIFHAQLESEMVLLERDAAMKPSPLKGPLDDTKHAVTNTCLSCHGAMGQRQLEIDAANDPNLDPNFSVDYFYLEERLSKKQKPQPNAQYTKYGQLAREGISCAICHHIDQPSEQQVNNWTPPSGWLSKKSDKELAYMLFHNNTGRFESGPADQFFGPFADVAEKPMERTLGVSPVHNEFITDSQLCGTCHTINLPNIGATEEEFPVLNAAETNPAFKDYQHSIEQATFLEWQNSVFAQAPDKKNTSFKSCQDCHMPGGFETLDGEINIDQITTQIAAIQDTNFPEADNRLPNDDIDIPLRDDYKRHEHVGLNVFLLEMFDQFPEILGVDKSDYMTGADNGVDTAIDNMILQAQKYTASIDVAINSVNEDNLTATVNIRNHTGHRFPSGVAFRRAFIEFSVFSGDEEIWASGRTNKVGVIVNGEGKPLATEFLPNGETYQPHYQKITRQDQVQIYEELNQNAQKMFTTSFIHRVFDIKDNRLLPDGWRASNFFKKEGEVLYQFFEATDPHGVEGDPDYQDQGKKFKGGDSLIYEVALPEGIDTKTLSVRATLYSQSISPSWLHQRFSTAPNGIATQRLYYMASRLNLENTPMKNWKLKLVSSSASVQ